MGYMFDRKNLKMVTGDSDTAAGFQCDLARTIINQLERQENVKENTYNTDGMINVALILQDNFATLGWQYTPMTEYIHGFIGRFQKYIDEQAERSDEEWDGEENKREHLTVWRKILNCLQTNVKRMDD